MSKRKTDATDVEGDMAAPAEKLSPDDSQRIVGDARISTDDPLVEYLKLIETYVTVDAIVDDAIVKENFEKIAKTAREVIWNLLFSVKPDVTAESQKKATLLLEEYRSDACFYAPWPYNEWICTLRDELLKRDLIDYWRDTVVKRQLGPCWSRDSDFFDGDEDAPVEFYAHAGCVAPFAASLTARAHQAAQPASGDDIDEDTAANNAAAMTGNFEAHISVEQPLTDYRNLMKRYVLTNIMMPDDIHKKNVDKIGTEARSTVWKLLFEGTPTQPEFNKAAELLLEYKSDAGFYGPWEFNEWIVKLRDELLERKMIEFWREKIVQLELGPCCSRDSDFFDRDDGSSAEFYNKAGCKAPFEC